MAMTETGVEGMGRQEIHERYLGISGMTFDRILGIVGGDGNR